MICRFETTMRDGYAEAQRVYDNASPDPSEADAVDDEDGFFGDDHNETDEARDMEVER